MTDDSDPLEILDAIDRERGDSSIGMIQANQVQRLRTEIVALRTRLDIARVHVIPNERAEARADALEDAARVCDEPARRLREERGWSAEAELLERYAAAIRALKEKRDV